MNLEPYNRPFLGLCSNCTALTLRFVEVQLSIKLPFSSYPNALIPQAVCKTSGFPTTETLCVLLIKIVSKCASIVDHRGQVALLAIESPYTNLSGSAVEQSTDSCNEVSGLQSPVLLSELREYSTPNGVGGGRSITLNTNQSK